MSPGGDENNIVFGVGSELAEVLFIGEGPGEQEDLKSRLSAGPGNCLTSLLDCVNLNRHKNIYIANMVKCRPPGPASAEEQEACIGWAAGTNPPVEAENHRLPRQDRRQRLISRFQGHARAREIH